MSVHRLHSESHSETHPDTRAAGIEAVPPPAEPLDPWSGGPPHRRAVDPNEPDEYVPGMRSTFPANDSLDGLAYMAGVPKLAREMADGMAARRGFEQTIAHQVAAGHAFSMNIMCLCNNQLLSSGGPSDGLERYQEIGRAAAATGLVAVRMMEAVQRGMLLLERLRNGIRHTYTVTRVDGRAGEGAAAPGEPPAAMPAIGTGTH